MELAAREGRLRRNFQGYTDDLYPVLVGLGASAISKFPEGYAQNASSTSAYREAVDSGRLATARGHTMTGEDKLRAITIESLMCEFGVNYDAIAARAGVSPRDVSALLSGIEEAFPQLLTSNRDGVTIVSEAREMTRLIARYIDAYATSEKGHSSAI